MILNRNSTTICDFLSETFDPRHRPTEGYPGLDLATLCPLASRDLAFDSIDPGLLALDGASSIVTACSSGHP
jgi:hypothetical protein